MDDDCYLATVPDLSRWCQDLPEDQDIAVVGFRYCNLPAGDLAPASSEPGESSVILGGASLLRRSAMLQTGGYLDWLVFAAEDLELAMRLRRLGYRIWYDPSVIVQHARSHEGRDSEWGNFYYVRNTLVINTIYGGWLTGVPLGLARALRRGWFHSDPCRRPWSAVWAGLCLYPRCWQVRRSLAGGIKTVTATPKSDT